MLLANLVGLMIVTTITGVLSIGLHVAGLARDFTVTAMIQWKCVLVKRSRYPGLRIVTILAIQPEIACMYLWLRVAIDAFTRSAFKDHVLVACFAFYLLMFPVQRKYLRMIEIAEPVNSIMAIQAG
jgi:hypothetical protein